MTAGVREPSPPSAAEPTSPTYKWIYVWHWPIRAMHWAAAVCIVVLAVTGLYIGKPYFMTGGEANPRFMMGWMRFTHFAAAAVLVATAIVRVYWLFVGNKYERWRALFPITPRLWRNLIRQVRYYAVFLPEKAPHYIGHNPLQQLSYTGLYAVAFIQVITGFALYGLSNPQGIFYALFGWVSPIAGGAQVVRFIHHVVTWIFVAFIPVHVYFAVRADVTEREASVSSVVSGGRYKRTDLTYEDE